MKKYLNTVSAFQVFQLGRYSTLILIGIVFTKTSLSAPAIGEYETFVFISGAITFFWLNGLLKAMLPLASNGAKTTNIFSAFVLIQLLSIVAALLLFVFQPLFSNFLLNGKDIPELTFVLFFIVFGVPANLNEYFYLLKKRNTTMVVYGGISFFIQLLLVTLPPILGFGIEAAIKGLTLSALLRYVWMWIIFVSNRELNFSTHFLKKHVKLGAPLVGATLLSGSAQFVDGFIVTSKFNEETFAVFRYGARELPLAVLLANALNSAMLPDFAKRENLKANLEKLKKNVTRLMHFLFPITTALIIVSKPLFPVVFNADFTESATIFNIYLLLVISRLLMPQTILNGLQLTKPILTASFFELFINVTLSLILVNYLGIEGIAFATFIAYLFEKIYLLAVVRKRLNVLLTEYLQVNIYLIYSFGIAVVFIFAEMIF